MSFAASLSSVPQKPVAEHPKYHHFEKWNAPNKASEAARSWLGIAPQFHLGPAANQDKNPGSLGFYFLLLMGQIVYGRL